MVTWIAQASSGAVSPLDRFPLGIRLANAVTSYVRYIFLAAWPRGLAAFYPHPGHAFPWWRPVAALLLLVGTTLLIIRARRAQPWLLAGCLWYLLTLLPVIGLVQVGAQALADRYTYMPLTGLFIAAVWGAAAAARRRRRGSALLSLAALAAVVVLSAAAVRQIGFWKDSETLLNRSLAVTEGNWFAQYNLGVLRLGQGKLGEAEALFEEALKRRPSLAGAQTNLGMIAAERGDLGQAVDRYRRALALDAGVAETHNNLGVALWQMGNAEGALTHYRRALDLNPSYVPAHNNLGNALAALGDPGEAVVHYEEAVRLDPDFVAAYEGLLALPGPERDAALPFLEELERLYPGRAILRNYMGRLRAARGTAAFSQP